MIHKAFLTSLVVTAIAALTPTPAGAWGAIHTGYTHIGYGGAQHYGRTAAYGPYGAYNGAHLGTTGYHPYNSGYHPNATNAYHTTNAYHHGAVNPAGYARASGAYRR
jgi:hypothetical protein